MIRAAALALSLCGLATPSLATEWINCAAPDGEATFDFLVGSVDFLAVVGVNISVGEQVWASSAAYGPGEPVLVGQAFETDDVILIDAVDEPMSAIIAQLRLFKAEEGGAFVHGGTLRIPGRGVWAVSCTGP
ncbi:MAG: hypothetical protein IPK28_06285 [Devosia sp.]|nr:hypothetical protein [Devosia sp.]